MSKQRKRLALQGHAYDASYFCIHCGAHAEVIADEIRFCLTAKQREKVTAISHLRAWQIRSELEKAVAIPPPEPIETRLLAYRLKKAGEILENMDSK